MQHILILYSSDSGNTKAMARHIARGVESITNATAVLRTVPPVSADTQATEPSVPESGAPYATLPELASCDALIMGSPTHFGNMTASLKHFLDQTTSIWFAGKLSDKPAAVFTSTGSLHGGQESTLISMMLPLLHHGMLISGLPYSNSELMNTASGGTPYGASHFATSDGTRKLDDDEQALCFALGRRVATIAQALNNATQAST